MNSILLLYGKTDFRPTYYGCIDKGVFLKMNNLLQKYHDPNIPVFISARAARYDTSGNPRYVLPVKVAYHTYDRWFKNKFRCRFSDNPCRGVYDMYSITHVLIQLAVYMGFKEIYLLGADCNQSKGKQIHFEEYGVPDTTIDTARERNIVGYKEVKKYCDNHDVTVYNATRGGELEVFERRNLDDVLKNIQG